MLAVGVTDTHPEQFLIKPTPTYLQAEGGITCMGQKTHVATAQSE